MITEHVIDDLLGLIIKSSRGAVRSPGPTLADSGVETPAALVCKPPARPTQMVQGSSAWRAARLGQVTASRISDVAAGAKGGRSASRDGYMAQLAIERLTGAPFETRRTPAMAWGAAKEPEARAAYETVRNVQTQQTGFWPHPRIALSGASPDALLGDDGLLEIKCPNSSTHQAYRNGRKLPRKYHLQMQWQMACTGRRWCDFLSYDPRAPERRRVFALRVDRDQAVIDALERAATEFLCELDWVLGALTRRSQGAQRPEPWPAAAGAAKARFGGASWI